MRTFNFTPGDEQGVARQQALAQLLMQQGQQGAPAEWQGMRVMPKYGIGHGLTQLASALSGAYLQKKADEGKKSLDEEKRQRLVEWLQNRPDGSAVVEEGTTEPALGGEAGALQDQMSVAPAPSREQQLRNQRLAWALQGQELGDIGQAVSGQTLAQEFAPAPRGFTGTLSPGEVAYMDGRQVAAIPKPAETAKLTDDEREYIRSQEDPAFAEYLLSQKRAAAPNVSVGSPSVNLPNPMIADFSKRLDTQLADAEAARSQISSIQEARTQLDRGIISGFAAEPRLGFAKAMNMVGLNDAETIRNTETYLASTAQQVATLIRNFGAGTGLSDKDREFAAQMAAGTIKLDKGSMSRILDINERVARAKIKIYNKTLERGVKGFPDLNTLYDPIQEDVNSRIEGYFNAP